MQSARRKFAPVTCDKNRMFFARLSYEVMCSHAAGIRVHIPAMSGHEWGAFLHSLSQLHRRQENHISGYMP